MDSLGAPAPTTSTTKEVLRGPEYMEPVQNAKEYQKVMTGTNKLTAENKIITRT